MRKLVCFLAILIFPLRVSLYAAPCSSATPVSGIYAGADGPAQYVLSMPSPANCYNGEMIFFAHGYVAQGSPANAWLSQLVLPDGTSLPGLVNSFGFGFAASSFSRNGLSIPEGVQDTAGLADVLKALGIPAGKYFITGASEGGLVAAKSLETQSALYSGAVAVCGPIGSFQQQINYFGDVRVLFDYFFPGVLKTGTPGESAISIPPALQQNWFTVYEPNVLKALAANPLATLQLLLAADIPVGLTTSTVGESITGALWYNVFATNDAIATLNGNPYGNLSRVYHGSLNDARMNAMVARFAESPVNLSPYETTGILHDPLVTLHTIADPIIPFRQELLYAAKAQAKGSSAELTEIPAVAYGHCNVNKAEAASALLLMLARAGK
ncbi:MAG TPA: hypothetical protein VGK48_18500 [Terriglobia bacterium]|jgi:pimeloyl-ACP methyl ester carboxylesterase